MTVLVMGSMIVSIARGSGAKGSAAAQGSGLAQVLESAAAAAKGTK